MVMRQKIQHLASTDRLFCLGLHMPSVILIRWTGNETQVKLPKKNQKYPKIKTHLRDHFPTDIGFFLRPLDFSLILFSKKSKSGNCGTVRYLHGIRYLHALILNSNLI